VKNKCFPILLNSIFKAKKRRECAYVGAHIRVFRFEVANEENSL
jgi:hypothetical protein